MNDEIRTLPHFIRRDVERAIEDATHPKGMCVHDGKAYIGADRLAYMLRLIDNLSALAQQPAPVAVPAEWKLVPVKPTPEMWKATDGIGTEASGIQGDDLELVWAAMLSAAPTVPVAVPENFTHDNKALERLLNATALLVETPCADSGMHFASCLADVEAMLAATPAAPAAVEPVDNDAFAAALAEKVIAYIGGAARIGMDWKSGLAGMIARRTSRLAAPPAAEKPNQLEQFTDACGRLHSACNKVRDKLAEMEAAEQPDTVKVSRELLAELREAFTERDALPRRPGHAVTASQDHQRAEGRVWAAARALLAGGEA